LFAATGRVSSLQFLETHKFFASSPGSGDSLYQISSSKAKNFLSALLFILFAELAMFQLGDCRQAGKKVVQIYI
jgi:hypothetical protein